MPGGSHEYFDVDTYIECARFADDLVILIDAYQRHDWLMAAVEKRLREEFCRTASRDLILLLTFAVACALDRLARSHL